MARGHLRRSVLRSSIAVSACAALAGLGVACRSSFQQFGASAIVNAPNRGAPLPSESMTGEVRIPVGPPAATLSVEIVDAKSPRGTIFVLHGVRADKRSLRPWAQGLVAAGFRAVLVDLRGHGRSTGDWLSFGVVESRDLVQVLDALDAHGDRVGDVGAIGMSYGAATAIEWAAIDRRVKAVIAVAPFASLRDVVPNYAPILPDAFIASAIDLAGQTGGFNPDDASPVTAITRTDASLLLIHGLDDRKIPASHSTRIFEARREHSELLLVAGADHGAILSNPTVLQRAPAFFESHLIRNSPSTLPDPAVPDAVPR